MHLDCTSASAFNLQLCGSSIASNSYRDSQIQQLATPARQQLSTMQSAPRQLAAASAMLLHTELATSSASASLFSAPAPGSSCTLVFSFSAMQQQQPRPRRQRSASLLEAAMQQYERIQLSFSFSYSAARKSSSIDSFGFGCSLDFSDACICPLARATLHCSRNSEQLSPRLTLRRRLGESYNSSLYLFSCIKGRLQHGLVVGSDSRPAARHQ